MIEEEIEVNIKPTKLAKDVMKTAKKYSLEDLENVLREKPLYEKYPFRADNISVKLTHQWLRNSSLKTGTAGFLLAA